MRRQLDRTVMTDVLQQTTTTTAFIFAVFVGATAYSLVLRGLGGDELMERALLRLPFGPRFAVRLSCACLLASGFGGPPPR